MTATQTLTNKTINGPDNTLTNIANSSLANSSITFARVGGNSTAASLGDTVSFQGTASEVTVGENSGTFTIGLPASVAITTGLTVNSLTVATTTGTETLTNKTLTDPVLTPTATTGGKIEFLEGTNNGTNKATLIGPASTADVTITLPAATGTVAVSVTSPLSLSSAGDISLGTVPIAKGGTNSTSASDARTALDVQQLNANLTAISGLTSAADTGLYFTGSGTAGTFTLGSIGRTFLGATNIGNAAGSQRKLLALDNSDNVQFNSLGVGTAGSGTTGEIRATDNITGYYSSDSRLKENIQNIPDALDKVMMLKGVTFDWTDEHIKERGGEDNYFVKKHDTGLIAQDVQQVLPEIVRKKKDGYLGVQYDKTVGLLVEAIKELKAEIDQLKSKG